MNETEVSESEYFFASLCERANVLLRELNRPEEALPLLHQALEMDPENSEVLTLMAMTNLHFAGREVSRFRLMGVGYTLRFLHYYFAAIRADPNSENTYILRIWGLSLIRARRRALRVTQEAIRFYPENPNLLVTLSEAFLACRRYAEAEEAALNAREHNPENVDIHLLLAQIKQKQKRWSDAETHCLNALALAPEHSESLYNLGKILWVQNRQQEAVERFFEALALKPDNYEYKRMHSWAARRTLLPPWAGKGFARLLTVLVLTWTALLYTALLSRGIPQVLSFPTILFWGSSLGHGVFTYPYQYIPSYRQRLTEEQPPAIAIAIRPESGETSLPDEPNFLAYLAWVFIFVFLLAVYGDPLVHLWKHLAETTGRAPVWLFILFSVIVWWRLTPPQKKRPKAVRPRVQKTNIGSNRNKPCIV